jgi:hypothetical protein
VRAPKRREAAVTSFKFIKKWLSREPGDPRLFAVGDRIRIARTARSPLPGELGSIMDISPDDPLGPFLVQFANGLQFRYRAQELEVVGTPALEANGERSSHVESLALRRASR